VLQEHLVGYLFLGSVDLVHQVLSGKAQHGHVLFVFGRLLALLPVCKYTAAQERVQLLLVYKVTLEEDLARIALFLAQTLHKGCFFNTPVDRFLLFLEL